MSSKERRYFIDNVAEFSKKFLRGDVIEIIDDTSFDVMEWAIRNDSVLHDGLIKARENIFEDRKLFENLIQFVEKKFGRIFGVDEKNYSKMSWLEIPSLISAESDEFDPLIYQWNELQVRIALDSITRRVGAVFLTSLLSKFFDKGVVTDNIEILFPGHYDDKVFHIADTRLASVSHLWTLIELLNRNFVRRAILDNDGNGSVFPTKIERLYDYAETRTDIQRLRGFRHNNRQVIDGLLPCFVLGMIIAVEQKNKATKYMIGPSGVSFMHKIHAPLCKFILKNNINRVGKYFPEFEIHPSYNVESKSLKENIDTSLFFAV